MNIETKATTATVIKLRLKYSPMSQSNTCVAELNLKILLFV